MTHIRTRRARVLPLAAVALLGGAHAAHAQGPVFEMPAQFTGAQAAGGTLVPDREPGFAAVRSPPRTGVQAGHWGQLTYCNPYGPGTAIVGYLALVGRWHDTLGDGVRILHNTDGGTVRSDTDASLPERSAAGAGMWAGAQTAMTPTQCLGLQVVARTTRAGTFAWTVDLERVAIRDDDGPWVAAPAVAVPWVTGDHAPVSWDQGDNGFARGTTWAEVAGGGTVSLGDPGNGRVAAAVPLGGLPDGRHVVRVHRSGAGWPTRTADVAVGVDRTDPATPSLSVDTEAWTNAPGVGVAADPSDDGGSGWDRNEFQTDGGPWTTRGNRWIHSEAGVHTVRVRAVDRAGRVSAPSRQATLRIDRVTPTVPVLETDATHAAGPRIRVVAEDAGGSGLGHCAATVSAQSATGLATPVLSFPSRAFATETEVDLPMRGLPSGDYTVTVTVCDAAGNTATRRVRMTWRPQGAPGAGAGPAAPGAPLGSPPAPDMLGVTTVPGVRAGAGRARLELAGAVRVVTRRNRVAVLRGRLLADGLAVPAGTRVAITDPRGRHVGTVRTGRAGALTVRFRATSAGRWRLRRLAPGGGSVVVAVTLLPSKPGTRGGR